MATHPSSLAWGIPWTEEPGGLPSMGLRGIRHDWSGLAHTHFPCILHGPGVKLIRHFDAYGFWHAPCKQEKEILIKGKPSPLPLSGESRDPAGSCRQRSHHACLQDLPAPRSLGIQQTKPLLNQGKVAAEKAPLQKVNTQKALGQKSSL